MMSIQDSLFKYFSDDQSLWQIITLRGLIAIPLLTIFATIKNQHHNLWIYAFKKWSLLRSLFMTLMFLSMYTAMPFLNLSVIAAGIYTAPIFVTLLSAHVIGEPVSRQGWIAIIMGFSGVMIILQPGTDAFNLWTIVPVFGGFLYALSNVTTRSKCQTLPVVSLALSLNLVLLLTGAVLSVIMQFWQPAGELIGSYPYLFDCWSDMGIAEWILIILLAILVIGIGMTLAGAYKSAQPSIVATFDYSYLIFVAIWDYLFFSNTPTGMTVLGMLLIVCAGLLVINRR